MTVNPNAPQGTTPPERLPLRWGLILVATALAMAVGFVLGGPLVAMGLGLTTVTALHAILA
ncbi:hypothetical protein GCM10009612_75670 [Streptomyces beijiangensis]